MYIYSCFSKQSPSNPLGSPQLQGFLWLAGRSPATVSTDLRTASKSSSPPEQNKTRNTDSGKEFHPLAVRPMNQEQQRFVQLEELQHQPPVVM
uniref:SFRICE_037513 n=1 Tax=Spodoptera frugiperda TaxID=7108 RepID=A0A2H1WXH6_SPOFR